METTGIGQAGTASPVYSHIMIIMIHNHVIAAHVEICSTAHGIMPCDIGHVACVEHKAYSLVARD